MELAVGIELCLECDRDLEHCHGTAIVHLDGFSECSEDPDCRLIAAAHWFQSLCEQEACQSC
ncbi:MAG: hypothetical protein JWM85_2927 [Acidimicrobiaceae bacterium]|nr:hypothetical protein [Acidimicrobiaceae bacterium]